jgi:RNA processing factor Prp31
LYVVFSILILFISFSIALLDDLDKETNNYIMRCKEWYGWHFPELAKIIPDNIAFCKIVQRLGREFCFEINFHFFRMFYYS